MNNKESLINFLIHLKNVPPEAERKKLIIFLKSTKFEESEEEKKKMIDLLDIFLSNNYQLITNDTHKLLSQFFTKIGYKKKMLEPTSHPPQFKSDHH
jgi:hypothetical protein